MSKESDEIIGLLLGIIGGAFVAYLIGKALEPRANCPVCRTLVTKGPSNTSTCPKCFTQLRWS